MNRQVLELAELLFVESALGVELPVAIQQLAQVQVGHIIPKLRELIVVEVLDPGTDIGTVTIRFKAPASWTAASIWAWDASNTSENFTGGTWPGTAMTLGTDGYYSITLTNVTASTIGAVINNGVASGGEQTVDLTTTGNICWTAGSLTSGKCAVTVDATCSSAINEVEAKHLSIYPNPTQNVLSIDTEDQSLSSCYRSLSGSVVKTSSDLKVNVSDLPAGCFW